MLQNECLLATLLEFSARSARKRPATANPPPLPCLSSSSLSTSSWRPSFLAAQGWGTYRQIKTGAGFKLKNKNGPFSSIWTATIARVGSFFSIFREQQDLQSFAPLRPQKFRKKSSDFFARMKFSFSFLQNSMNFIIFLLNFDEILSEFHEELREITKIPDIFIELPEKIGKC